MKSAVPSLWLIALLILFLSNFPLHSNGYETVAKSTVEIHSSSVVEGTGWCVGRKEACRPIVVQIKRRARAAGSSKSDSSLPIYKDLSSYLIVAFAFSFGYLFVQRLQMCVSACAFFQDKICKLKMTKMSNLFVGGKNILSIVLHFIVMCATIKSRKMMTALVDISQLVMVGLTKENYITKFYY